ncbi:hypothetical protein R1flu_006952 [Riccia fluitans]|uniref:Ubiquitin-like domain-containing protein n=1 Tax=Riccia fluitans TaxID=41844 RepID=A0ABD1YXP0_9MARC
MPSYKSPSPSRITAMFIRVKRKKTTYFLHCDPSETALEIKQKIQALSDNPVDCQRLILLSSQLVLEDSKSLADQKVENDAIVALCLKTSDTGVWEDICIDRLSDYATLIDSD